MKKIFVLNLRGDIIGDSIKESGLFEFLNKKYNESFLAANGSTLIKEIHKNNPYIDEFIEIKELNHLSQNHPKIVKAAYFLKAYFKIIRLMKGFDICVLTQKNKYPGYWLPKLAGVKTILFKNNLRYKKYGCKFYFEKKEEQKIKQQIEGKNDRIGINIESKDESRCWPKDNFARLINHLIKQDYNVYLLGTDKKYNECILKEQKEKIINLVGKTSIRETALIIKNLDLYIGNDSGLTHVAAAVNTNSITILINSDTEILYNPKKSKAIKLRNPSVEEVIRTVENVLQNKK